MAEHLLIRHAQAFANKGEFAAFGNKESPLTQKGWDQCATLRDELMTVHGVIPETYTDRVAASEYVRPQETAYRAGFTSLDILPILNEPDFSRGTMTGVEIVRKHREERWAPDEARRQARRLIDLLTSDTFPYPISFTHGMFTATVLLELEEGGHNMSNYVFDEKRGYVPLQAAITRISL